MIRYTNDGTFSPSSERVSAFFKVLSDEGRIKILTALLDESLCVTHLCQKIGMEQSAMSHNLAILRKANLVKASRSDKNRVYSIADEHVRLILDMAILHLCEEH